MTKKTSCHLPSSVERQKFRARQSAEARAFGGNGGLFALLQGARRDHNRTPTMRPWLEGRQMAAQRLVLLETLLKRNLCGDVNLECHQERSKLGLGRQPSQSTACQGSGLELNSPAITIKKTESRKVCCGSWLVILVLRRLQRRPLGLAGQ